MAYKEFEEFSVKLDVSHKKTQLTTATSRESKKGRRIEVSSAKDAAH